MIVVGYVYNTNGMATWCFEIANTLQQNGYEVIVIHSPTVQLPKSLKCRSFEYEYNRVSNKVLSNFFLFRYLQIAINLLVLPSNNFLNDLHSQLLCKNITPNIYLLNQSDFVSNTVGVKQFVCAWVYPFSIKTYIYNAIDSFKKFNWKYNIRLLITSIGFYRKDKAGLKKAYTICALTPEMHQFMLRKGYKSVLLTPTISNQRVASFPQSRARKGEKIIFSMAALDLQDPRKKIIWLLRVLESMPQSAIINLYGTYSSLIQDLVKNSKHEINLRGYLQRDELLADIIQSDMFIYGSTAEDWGYIVSEAMSLGIVVLAPNRHPFDYMIGIQELLYEDNNQEDLLKKIQYLVECPDELHSFKMRLRDRYDQLLSPTNFVNQFRALINE